jgi:hypothetical protein
MISCHYLLQSDSVNEKQVGFWESGNRLLDRGDMMKRGPERATRPHPGV